MSSSEQRERIGTRFQIEAVLGKGGMAVVYLARDATTGQQVALKQLRCEKPSLRERVTSLFQQEYATLSELSHPNIVRVFDYGVSHDGPYYTMELLQCDDLHSASNMHWREVCRVLRDVASALALVHSRRLVHRDVTPRNVRRTADGHAKLIDFGALAPMGEAGIVIGTPPFVPPELLHGQPLDGRADLYALGAMAYRLLTGQHAFAARTIPELPARWESAPAPIGDVPPKLSALVLSLLSFDVLARPSTAWEVIARLTSIAELPAEDDTLAEHAYLVTPSLVGREVERRHFQDALHDAIAGTGSVVWLQGAPGIGRSRLLATFALDARLAGVPVVRASGGDGDDAPFSIVHSFIDGLQAFGAIEIPQDVRDALSEPPVAQTPDERDRSRTQTRSRIVEWIASLMIDHALVLAVDDPQRLDAASATLLGELVHLCADHRLVVALALCAEDGAIAVPWIGLLQQYADPLVLPPLDEPQVEALMRSVFGDTEQLRPLANALHRISVGNPGACMGLAQHLLDHGDVHYEQGRWVLPADAQALDLPDDLSAALSRRFSRLRPAARDLADALALVDPLSTIRAQHYAALLPTERGAQVHSALAELISADIVRARGETFVISHPALSHALQQAQTPDVAEAIHLRLATLYASEPYADLFMQAWHLHNAGRRDAACELLLKHAAEVNAPDQLARGVAARSRGYYRFAQSVYEAALEHCERTQAPPRAKLELRRALVYLAAYLDPRLVRHAVALIEQLRADTGLIHWDSAEMPTDPTLRLLRCLSLAQHAHDATDPSLRCCTPAEAVRVLAQVVSVLAGAHSRMLDVRALETLPPLIQPLATLAPTLRLIAETVQSSCDACSGLETTQRCLDLIHDIEANPATQGDEIALAIVHALRYYVGVWEARQGSDVALRRAADIEQDVLDWAERFPYHTGLGRYRSWHVRRLGHLYNGSVEEARECRERIELLQLDGLDPLVTPNLHTGIYMEARAHAWVGSLGELRGTIDVIERLAASTPTWEPVLHWAHGEYHLLREDYVTAREALKRALDLTAPGRSVVWAWAASAAADNERLAGDAQLAISMARDALRACEGMHVPILTIAEFERVRLLAQASVEGSSSVAAEFDALLSRVTSVLGGVPLGRLYEARAHVAILARDIVTFDRYVERVDALYRPGKHPALIAKLDKLAACKRAYEGVTSGSTGKRRATTVKIAKDGQRVTEVVRAAMRSCANYNEAADSALGLLMDHTEADAGCLITLSGQAIEVSACIECAPPSDELLRCASELASGNLSVVTNVSTGRHPTHHPTDFRFKTADPHQSYLPLLIPCARETGDGFAVVVMVRVDANRQPRVPMRMTQLVSEYLAKTFVEPQAREARPAHPNDAAH